MKEMGLIGGQPTDNTNEQTKQKCPDEKIRISGVPRDCAWITIQALRVRDELVQRALARIRIGFYSSDELVNHIADELIHSCLFDDILELGQMTKILIVDDNAALRASLRRTLKENGYRVVEVENGKRALESIARGAPDLVVTDLLMPEMDGLEFIAKVRQTNSGLPVIAMSGSVETVYLMAAEKFGAVAILEKPFTPEDLTGAIQKALKNGH